MNHGRRPLAMPSATQRRISAVALHRILPAVRLLHAHAEDAADRLVAHRGAVLLGVLAVGPRSHQPAARLAVGEQDGRQRADRPSCPACWSRRRRVGDEAGVGIDAADLRVPEAPQLEKPLLAPKDVGAAARDPADRCVRGRSRPGRRSEILAAVLAIAHPRAGPAVDEDPVHPVRDS